MAGSSTDPLSILPNLSLADDTTKDLRLKIDSLRNQMGQRDGYRVSQSTLTNEGFDTKSLQGLLLTSINGMLGLPEQRVTVEYLRSNQLLRIPSALVYDMKEPNNSPIDVNPTLTERISRLCIATYRQLREVALSNVGVSAMRVKLDAIKPDAPTAGFRDWYQPEYYDHEIAADTPDSQEVSDMVFGTISLAYQFNCDIRDVGILLQADMRLSDNYWQMVPKEDEVRFTSKLRAYTTQSIAAMNLASCADEPLAAWTRAFTLSAGVLPTDDSESQCEYLFDVTMPSAASRAAVNNFAVGFPSNLFAVCLNVSALFGLLHLNKDHTFRTGDSNMARINVSYLQSLRTILHNTEIDRLKGNMEPIMRTATHPFGLGQTYGLALYMGKYNKLAAALAKRVDVMPPPVQRIEIVRAAVREWSGLAAGRLLNETYYDQILAVDNEHNSIAANAPSYSGLYRLYGLKEMNFVKEIAKEAADQMMPLVCGYAMSQHTSTGDVKDGLALALSLTNVTRDNRALTQTFQTLWDNYMDGMDDEGLVKFAEESLRATRGVGRQ